MDFEISYAQSGSLETVRALHQTIVALRTALEATKNEILELKQKSWPIDSVQNTLTALTIENHALRQQILCNNSDLVKEPESNFEKVVSSTEDFFDEKGVDSSPKGSESFREHLVQELGFNQKPTEAIITKDFLGLTESSDKNYNLNPYENKTFAETYLINKKNDENIIHKITKEDLRHVKFEEPEEQSDKDIYDLVSREEGNYNLSRNIAYHHILATQNTDIEDTRHHTHSDLKFEKPNETASNEIQFCDVSAENIPKKVRNKSPKLRSKQKASPRQIFARIQITAEKRSKNKSKSLESLTVLKSPVDKKFTFTKTISFSNLSVQREFKNRSNSLKKTEMDKEKDESNTSYIMQDLSPQNDLDQEVDDIELIFTTDDTDTKHFKEELVPIDERESNSNLLQMPLSDYDQISDRELDDDVFNDNNENQENSNFQSFELRRDNSILNSKSDNSINHEEKSMKSYYSYQDSSFEKSFDNKSLEKDESFDRFEERVRIVETDMSKIGIQEMEYVGVRRNTCPNPVQYRPLSHRDAMAKCVSSRKPRPILTHSNAVRRESEAQTDISALPGTSWRSESSLAHKVKGKLGENFTTLPSKIPHPGSRLRLSEKTVEARRVLLSDIGFTSMVPELSRSADHLFPGIAKPPTVTTYGQFLRATDLYSPNCASQKFTWTATTTTPDVSQSQSRYSSVYPLYSPPAPSRRCSAPVSPSRRALLKPTSSKVRFTNGSLPELRTDWTTVDSGDSTDSLVDEAENYLRRSIDCLVTGRDTTSGYRRTVPRRASAPESCRDNVPPMGWQPFLPRLPRDLKLDHWVKVITPEGKVRGGRVRYVGIISSQGQEHFIGVQLACPEGVNDGTWGNKRYFQCEPYHGIFVPFKKVIMGWRP